jgi:hypothetical protein
MRWLTLLVFSIVIGLSGQAFALPHDDAEQAYASGDYKTAFALWLPLAEQGSARAQMNIARMYEKGEWVAQDSAQAAEWYHRAAENDMRDTSNTATAGTQQVVGPQPTSSQAIVTPPPPVYTQPVNQPVYYPVVVPRVPVFVPFHRHWHR